MTEIEIEEKRNYIIYKIGLSDGYEYIGSSCEFKDRVNNHISVCYNEKIKSYNTPLYKHVREHNLKFDKDNFVVLEEIKNITKKEARMIEEEYRKEAVKEAVKEGGKEGGNVLNSCRAYMTKEERKEDKKENGREYRIKNKYKKAENAREWYIKNRDRLLKKQKEKYTCICGSVLIKGNKLRHEQSNKHINFISRSSN